MSSFLHLPLADECDHLPGFGYFLSGQSLSSIRLKQVLLPERYVQSGEISFAKRYDLGVGYPFSPSSAAFPCVYTQAPSCASRTWSILIGRLS